jgi:hypothetical protein
MEKSLVHHVLYAFEKHCEDDSSRFFDDVLDMSIQKSSMDTRGEVGGVNSEG